MDFISEATYWIIAGFFLSVGGFGGLSVVMILSDWIQDLKRKK